MIHKRYLFKTKQAKLNGRIKNIIFFSILAIAFWLLFLFVHQPEIKQYQGLFENYIEQTEKQINVVIQEDSNEKK